MTRTMGVRRLTRWRSHRWSTATSRAFLAFSLAAVVLVSPGFRSSASAVGEPVAPTIHCAWVLPNAGDATSFVYGPDDDTTTVHSAGTPCALGPEGEAFQPNGAPGLAHLIVDKNHDGSSRDIELWAAVSHATSDAFASESGTVNWKVKAPDGTLVAQVFPTGRSCAGTSAPGPMWDAASNGPTGLGVFAPEAIDNLEGRGLWQSCRQGRVRMFFGRLTLVSGAACGAYTVTASATVAERTSELSYGFEVVCPTDAVLDVSDVHWNVSPGGAAIVVGDVDPTTNGSPTVTNKGPNPIQVGLVFTPLKQAGSVDLPTIAEFGALLAPLVGARTGLSRIAADTPTWFPGPASIVCPGASVKLNLTVYAPVDLPYGQYAGTVRLISRTGGRC